MIIRKVLLALQLLFVHVAAQNDQTEGSGNLQELTDQEGSGVDTTSSVYARYLDSQFEPSIEEALLSSDSWVVENTNNDIIFVDGPEDGAGITNGDDEDYVAEISGNNPLETAEEETNALADLELDRSNTRTFDTTTSAILQNGNEIEMMNVDSDVHVEGNALGKTGVEETQENPVLNKYSGLSAILLLAAAVGIGALLSFVGFVITKLRPCRKGLDVP